MPGHRGRRQESEGDAVPWINPYVKKDGTHVRGHSRWAPGARHQMAVLVLVGIVVCGSGSGQIKIVTGDSRTVPGSRLSVPAVTGGQR